MCQSVVHSKQTAQSVSPARFSEFDGEISLLETLFLRKFYDRLKFRMGSCHEAAGENVHYST